MSVPLKEKGGFKDFFFLLVAKQYSSFSPKIGGEKKYRNLFSDI